MDTISTQSPMFAAFKAETKVSFVRAYDPKSASIEGFRHAVIRYRDTGKNTVSKVAQMVTVPQLTISGDWLLPETATKVLLGVLEDAQDVFIRGQLDDSKTVINWDDLATDKMLALLTAVRVSQRLTSEQIANWCDVALSASCEARGKERAGAQLITDAGKVAEVIAATKKAYRERFSRLAAPVPNLDQQSAISLKNMLAVSKVDDDISRSLSAKLEAILNPKVIDNTDL